MASWVVELIVARREEAEAIGGAHWEYSGLDITGIHEGHWQGLYEILTGRTDAPQLNCLCEPAEYSAVLEVPEPYVGLLAELTPKCCADLASVWPFSQPPEAAGARGELIQGLAERCREARAGGKSVLLWVSL